ncbi:MAG: murein transglycosylase [Desulfobacula sp.]|jgi:membrane-bound lytic murein transglycosylase A|nr:murein transglycosylase [Desulfobacula sp.]
MLKKRNIVLLLIILYMLAGCYPGLEKLKAPVSLKRVHISEYPRFSDDMDYKGLLDSLNNSLIYFRKIPAKRTFTFGKKSYTAAHMIRSLEVFKAFIKTNPSAKNLNKWIKKYFAVYRATGNQNGEVLFTGYFEPLYPGSREAGRDFPYPVYSKPDDLLQIKLSLFSEKYKGHKTLMAKVNKAKKQVEPYYTRQEIVAQRDFYKSARPIAWMKSRVDRFFLEIQGSGRIDLGNGEMMRVQYAAVNGRPYSSIGRYLINKNEIPREEMSMQAIRQWLDKHPNRVDEVLSQNKSYVFFKEGTGGPYGSLGVTVNAFRSLATDSRLFPKGALCFIETFLPDKNGPDQKKQAKNTIDPKKEWEKSSFFVLNQDTGGAIKGPGRADLFCGNGDYAELTAGYMQHHGQVFFLVLKSERE